MAVLAGACGSSGPPTPSAASAPSQIASAYQTLFNFSDKSLGPKEAVVQDGASLAGGLEQGETSSFSSGVAGARVDSTTIISDSACTTAKVPVHCAKVTYDILGSGGMPVLAGQSGYATYATGKWLVAKVTICGLLESLYSVEQKPGLPPGCSAT